MSTNLRAFYTERARLAYAIEHMPDGHAFLPEYQIVDAHLRVHEQSWRSGQWAVGDCVVPRGHGTVPFQRPHAPSLRRTHHDVPLK